MLAEKDTIRPLSQTNNRTTRTRSGGSTSTVQLAPLLLTRRTDPRYGTSNTTDGFHRVVTVSKCTIAESKWDFSQPTLTPPRRRSYNISSCCVEYCANADTPTSTKLSYVVVLCVVGFEINTWSLCCVGTLAPAFGFGPAMNVGWDVLVGNGRICRCSCLGGKPLPSRLAPGLGTSRAVCGALLTSFELGGPWRGRRQALPSPPCHKSPGHACDLASRQLCGSGVRRGMAGCRSWCGPIRGSSSKVPRPRCYQQLRWLQLDR